MTRDGLDVEGGIVTSIAPGSNVTAFHSWSTASTVATLGLADDESISAQVSSPEDKVKSSRVIPVSNRGDDARHTTCRSITILIFGIAILAVIATSVAFCSAQPNTQQQPHYQSDTAFGASMETLAGSDISQQGFWNPLVDLHVTYDSSYPYRYILQDQSGRCNPAIATNMSTNEDSMNDWTGVQPTPQSIASMGILPHIQTSEDSFLALKHECGLVLSPDHNWTLSFAGARLATGDIDIIFLGDDNNDDPDENSSFAICYIDDNSIGIGACTGNDNNSLYVDNKGENQEDNDDETLVVPLLYSTRDVHVLTITYDAPERRIQIYQDTHLAADLDLDKVSLPTSVSWIGPPHLDDSSNSVASRIALRHVSYFDRHVEDGNVVEIADLTLHMSL